MHFWKPTAGLVSILAMGGPAVSAFEHQPHERRNFVPPLRPRTVDYELQARDARGLNSFEKRAPLFYWHSDSGNVGINLSAESVAMVSGCALTMCTFSYIKSKGLNRVIAEVSAALRVTPEHLKPGFLRAGQAAVRGVTGDHDFTIEDLQGDSTGSATIHATASSAPHATETSHPQTEPAGTHADEQSNSRPSASHSRPGQASQSRSQGPSHYSSGGSTHPQPARHNTGTQHKRDQLDFMFDDDLLFARDLMFLYEDEFDF